MNSVILAILCVDFVHLARTPATLQAMASHRYKPPLEHQLRSRTSPPPGTGTIPAATRLAAELAATRIRYGLPAFVCTQPIPRSHRMHLRDSMPAGTPVIYVLADTVDLQENIFSHPDKCPGLCRMYHEFREQAPELLQGDSFHTGIIIHGNAPAWLRKAFELSSLPKKVLPPNTVR